MTNAKTRKQTTHGQVKHRQIGLTCRKTEVSLLGEGNNLRHDRRDTEGFDQDSVYQNYRHKHFDVCEDGSVYVFEHDHNQMTYPSKRRKVTPWILFLIFLLGTCEVLFPLLAYPAAGQSSFNMILLIITYLIGTIATVVGVVTLIYYGFYFINTEWLDKHVMPISGLSIAACGAGMIFLGW